MRDFDSFFPGFFIAACVVAIVILALKGLFG